MPESAGEASALGAALAVSVPEPARATNVENPGITPADSTPAPDSAAAKANAGKAAILREPEPDKLALAENALPPPLVDSVPTPLRAARVATARVWLTVSVPAPASPTARLIAGTCEDTLSAPEPDKLAVVASAGRTAAERVPAPERLAVVAQAGDATTDREPEPDSAAGARTVPSALSEPEPASAATTDSAGVASTPSEPEPARLAVVASAGNTDADREPEPERVAVSEKDEPPPVAARTSHASMLYCCPEGAVRFIVTAVPDELVVVVCFHECAEIRPVRVV
jgi:hypothetical protein